MKHSMQAIAAAANAIDGFYGTVKPLINPPSSRAKRHRQCLETFKLGFSVGAFTGRWLADLDWLFDLRDRAVHSSEALRQLVVVRNTDATVVAGSLEVFELSSLSAGRAAALAVEIITTCLEHPKRSTKDFVATVGASDAVGALA